MVSYGRKTLTSMIFPSPPPHLVRYDSHASMVRLPRHVNIAQAKAIDDCDPAKLQVLFELGTCDFNRHSWGLTSASLCELMG